MVSVLNLTPFIADIKFVMRAWQIFKNWMAITKIKLANLKDSGLGERALEFCLAIASKRSTMHSLGIFTIVFIVLLVDRNLYRYMMDVPEYGVSTKYLADKVLPDWSDAPGKKEYNYHFENSFDEGLTQRLHDELKKDAWVKRIVAVGKSYPDTLRIQVERRRPLAAVSVNRFYYLVDWDGVVLPGRYTSLLPELELYQITGVAELPPKPGEKWEGAVSQAVEVAGIMATNDLFAKLGVKVIDVSNADGRADYRQSEITLWTESGVGILWGRAPSTDKFGEISAEEKISNLKKAISLYPNLDGLKYVKLYIKDYPSVILGSKGRVKAR